MNRRNVISIFALALMVPATLIARPPKNKPESPSCKDCKKCGRACKCDCKKGCKCKPGCCKAERPSPPRGFDGRTPNFQPPHSKPTRGFDGRTPSFGPPSHSRSPQGRPPQGRPSPDRESRYKEMMKKFDKNKDGKLDEKEREAIREYMKQKMNRSSR
jgi:hypothetical protein